MGEWGGDAGTGGMSAKVQRSAHCHCGQLGLGSGGTSGRL